MKKLKILIVEDDKSSELLLFAITKQYSKKTIVSNNGLESLNIVRSNPDIDLIFMDIRMPVMDGCEVIKRIREFNQDVIIFVTSASDHNENSMKCGANEFVPKPIKIQKLQELIEIYFKN